MCPIASKKPLKRLSLATQLRARMEQRIREGTWPIGSRIPAEAVLAGIFEVSHNTVREAVQGLIHAGMLLARPGDGTYVLAENRLDAALDARLMQVDMSTTLEARLAIEKAVVALAAIHCTPEDMIALQLALDACKLREGQGIDADMKFHCLIADCTRNPILSQIYRVMASYLSRHGTAYLQERQYDPEALALHDDLLAALGAHDAQAAQLAVERIVEFDQASLGA